MTYWMKPKAGTQVRIPEDAISDFLAVNRRSYAIQTDRIRGACSGFISTAEAKEVRPTLDMSAYVNELSERRLDAVQQFLKRQKGEALEELAPVPELEPPLTIHSLSRFGFNAAHDTAVGGRRYWCGSECLAVFSSSPGKGLKDGASPMNWRC